jgi:dUTP pyrophosphatase
MDGGLMRNTIEPEFAKAIREDEVVNLSTTDLVLSDQVPIGFKVLRAGAKPPRYAKPGDAGFDLIALDDLVVPESSVKLLKLGFSLEIPPGYEVQIRPRSGKARLWGSYIANSPGTIDSGYRGEICLLIQAPLETIIVRKGDAVAQGVLKRVPKAIFIEKTELSNTERGEGGFGHTGE